MKCWLPLLVLQTVVFCSEGFLLKAVHNQEKKYVINKNVEYILTFPHELGEKNPYRVHVSSPNSNVDFPVFVVVRQERRVTAWQIPLLVKSYVGVMEYKNTSRTLCYDTKATVEQYHKFFSASLKEARRNFTVSISTLNDDDITVYVKTHVVKDYFIESEKTYEARFTPSEPIFYSYNFPKAEEGIEEIKTVLVHVESNDDVCFVVSVQPKACPVKDLNDEIMYNGKYQTVNTKGGLTISRLLFPDGFLIAFVSKGDNYDCTQISSLVPMPRQYDRVIPLNQTTGVQFQVRLGKTIKQYIAATMVVLWANVGLCLLLAIATVMFYYFGRYRNVTEPQRDSISEPLRISTDEIDSYFDKKELKVSDFVKNGKLNNKKALNYFWHIMNIAIFYGIPVVQLMISYQRSVNSSGNLDLCYHNFHCSHPFYFTDFNHIYSNIGYVLFGILFLSITYFRNRKIKNQKNCGIPKFHGLFYSMGMALIFEGVLSACYHICPNQSNFQFDTSFMYVMAALIMVKLYQNRHPDINASAYSTFSVLGIAVILAMFGILYNSVAVMIIFVVGHVVLCLYIGFKIYFFGYVYRGWKSIIKGYTSRDDIPKLIRPVRIGRFVTLSVANFCNLSIALTGIILYPTYVDFGTFLLAILMMNSTIYCIFYVIMKVVHKESICVEAILYGILGIISWGIGGYFFISKATTSDLTPADSRKLNKECILLDFYDTHDIWHLVSAPALFFSFMFLHTLDDDLFDKPQTEIDVF